jgi:hypothetical protein
MPPRAKAKPPTSPPKFGPPTHSRKRVISVTAVTPGNKRSRRGTSRLTEDEVVVEEEEKEEKEEEEEKEKEEEEMQMEEDGEEKEEERENMGMDMDVDVDKPAKGGRQGKKGKKGGKAAKGKKAEEKRAEEKKSVFFFFFFGKLIRNFGFTRLPLEKNGPSPKSKARKLRYI